MLCSALLKPTAGCITLSRVVSESFCLLLGWWAAFGRNWRKEGRPLSRYLVIGVWSWSEAFKLETKSLIWGSLGLTSQKWWLGAQGPPLLQLSLVHGDQAFSTLYDSSLGISSHSTNSSFLQMKSYWSRPLSLEHF